VRAHTPQGGAVSVASRAPGRRQLEALRP
jgi:hypothetical protein